jgi:hypothetical protein
MTFIISYHILTNFKFTALSENLGQHHSLQNENENNHVMNPVMAKCGIVIVFYIFKFALSSE